MKNEKLTLHQRIHNAFGCQEAEEIKAVHGYLHAGSRSEEEWLNLWDRSDEISWGHSFGRMHGWEEVWNGSVTYYGRNILGGYISMLDLYPEAGGKDPRAVCGLGMHTLASGVVEAAEDGMSVRTMFYTPGIMISNLDESGEKGCTFLWERYGSDFVFKDGGWWYLHEQVCPDIDGLYDLGNWGHTAYDIATDPNKKFVRGPKVELPDGSIGPDPTPPKLPFRNPPMSEPGPLHFNYGITQTVQYSVMWPEPYKTMDEEHIYSKYDY